MIGAARSRGFYPLMKFYNLIFRPHQVEGAIWLSKRSTGLLCLPTGQGKCLTSLFAYSKLAAHRKDIRCAVVLCPKNALMSWATDLENHVGCDWGQYPKDARKGKQVYLVPHSMIGKYIKAYVGRHKDVIFIVDEIDMFANPDTKYYPRLMELLREALAIWGLTATPIHKDLMHTYYTSEILFRGRSPFGSANFFARRFIRFRDRLIRKKNGREITIQEVIGHKNLPQLESVLMGYTYKSVMDAKVNFVDLPVELSAEDLRRYQEKGREILRDQPDTAASYLHYLQKLIDGVFDPDLGAKFDALVEYLPQFTARKNPFLIYVAYHDTVDRIVSVLKAQEIETYKITGKTSVKKRLEVVTRLRQGGPCAVVLTQAGTRGANLQFAESTICFDIPTDIKDLVQLLGRQCRLGSPFEENYMCFLAVTGTIDEYKCKSVMANTDLITKVICGTAILPVNTESITRRQVINLRKKLLWGQAPVPKRLCFG